MKPAPFDYIVPQTLEEALGLLHDLIAQGIDVKVIAGGQSLMPLMNMRLATPAVLIDLECLSDELAYIEEKSGILRVGPLTPHYQLEESPVIARACPIITEAEAFIGHSQIRSRGTIGGSLSHADPSAELPLIWTLLDGRATLATTTGQRVVGPEEFFISYLMTSLAPDEIITEVRLPVVPQGAGQALEEFAPRHGDFALAAVACQVSLDPAGFLSEARLAVGGAAPTPVDVSEVLEAYRGEAVNEKLAVAVAKKIVTHLDPSDDLHAGREYRLDLVRELARRAILKSYQRCLGTPDVLKGGAVNGGS